MERRGQVSMEYMTMLGLSLIIFAAVLYVATFLMSTSGTQIDVDTAYRAVQGIRESSDFIYVHGYPSKTRANVRIPGNIEELHVNNTVVRLRLGVGESYTDVYAVTKSKMLNIENDPSFAQICGGAPPVCREGYYTLSFVALDPNANTADVDVTVLT